MLSIVKFNVIGAQIIDMMLLVLDVNKGIQTQTAECLVIGEITTDILLVVLNKVDMIPIDEREAQIEKMKKRIRKAFKSTKFSNPTFVATSAAVGGEKVASVAASQSSLITSSCQLQTYGIDNLIKVIEKSIRIPKRQVDDPFLYAIDHCFAIKGHGTVLTGTVLRGTCKINQSIEIPSLQITRKVKSMQMFKKPTKSAVQGDRVAICISNVDHKLIERSIACQPLSMVLTSNVLCYIKKIRFFKSVCKSNAKYHISLGHQTVTATVTFFGRKELFSEYSTPSKNEFDQKSYSDDTSLINESISSWDSIMHGSQFTAASQMENEVTTTSEKTRKVDILSVGAAISGFPSELNWQRACSIDYEWQDELAGNPGYVYGHEPLQYAIIRFQKSVYCTVDSLLIGSRLDLSDNGNSSSSGSESSGVGVCRLAFFGPVKRNLSDDEVSRLQLYTIKSKEAEVFRITDSKDGICRELIAWRLGKQLPENNGTTYVDPYVGMFVETERGQVGIISSIFGSDGKFKIKFNTTAFNEHSGIGVGSRLLLYYKRHVYDKAKGMSQTGLYTSNGEILHNFSVSVPLHDLNRESNKDVVNSKCSDKKVKSNSIQSVKICETVLSDEVPIVHTAEKIDSTMTLNSSLSASNANLNSSLPVSVNFVSSIVPPLSAMSTSTEMAYRIGIVDSIKLQPEDASLSSISSGRVTDSINMQVCIVSGAFRMEENIKALAGANVTLFPNRDAEVVGVLIGPFAKLGKCKVHLVQNCLITVKQSVYIHIKPA